jgi:hypothetical protein
MFSLLTDHSAGLIPRMDVYIKGYVIGFCDVSTVETKISISVEDGKILRLPLKKAKKICINYTIRGTQNGLLGHRTNLAVSTAVYTLPLVISLQNSF